MAKLLKIKAIFGHKTMHVEKEVKIQGWVRTNRDNGAIGFLNVNDGSTLNGIQVVYKEKPEFSTLRTGDAIEVVGKIVASQGKQPIEVVAQSVKVINKCAEDYPLQKKGHTVEYLREISHLRGKTNLMMAVMKVRSTLAFAIHRFFEGEGFALVNTPIITGNDAEGAGESFTVTTRTDGKFEDDFFKKKASLTVSGQLHAEAYAQSFGKVYTFGPTFRAENSNTSRHAAEFWMLEPEIAFAGIKEDMDNAEKLVKFVLKYALKHCKEELQFLDSFVEKGLVERLEKVAKSKFAKMTYTQMVAELEKAVKAGQKFEDQNIFWGMDFGSEHERYIAEKVVNGPLFAMQYPKEIKAFYMRETKSNKKTVESFDMLIPGVGELIGGSARENDLAKLTKRMNEMGVPVEELQWYVDLRKFGGAPSAGYGLGFERLVMFVTGVDNIRDTMAFPRTTRNLRF